MHSMLIRTESIKENTMNDVKTKKETMRSQAKRARGLLSLDIGECKSLCSNFFSNIETNKNTVVAAYLPIERELDTHPLIDELLDKGITVALPVIQNNSRILKFVEFTNDTQLTKGKLNTCHPVINDQTQYLLPDIFIVPLLAFDRRGNRLGFGGGYYDATLAHYKKDKDIIAVGLAYAEQACLFNLPSEDHDIKMDLIITPQGTHSFKGE